MQLILELNEATRELKVTADRKDVPPAVVLGILHTAMGPFLQAVQPKAPLVQAAPAGALRLLKGDGEA